MKVTGVIAIEFDVEHLDDGDPSIETVRSVILDVAQAIRHQAAQGGVGIGRVTASIHDLTGVRDATHS